ncbi:hypothetical protein ACFL30_00540 [Candidatus Latescibacterota bacterium]
MAEVIGKASDTQKLFRNYQRGMKSRKSAVELDPESSFITNPMGNRSATIKNSIFLRKQIPDPLPSGIGSLKILPHSKINQTSATVKRHAFILDPIPKPAPSKVGSTRILPKSIIIEQSATVKQDIFVLKQSPEPRPSTIGDEDLPGGFRKENIISGRKNPTYDLVNGVVQIDDVKILFSVWA